MIADEVTVQKIIAALENESLKYETYYKLIIATGMRRGECCGLKWSDIDYDRFVFRRNDSRDPMTPSTFTWRFKMILKKNELPEKLNVHSLRHSNASLLVANGTDVATVASLLGYSQPSTTLGIYTHAFDKNKMAASEALHKDLDI